MKYDRKFIVEGAVWLLVLLGAVAIMLVAILRHIESETVPLRLIPIYHARIDLPPEIGPLGDMDFPGAVAAKYARAHPVKEVAQQGSAQ